MGRHRRQIALLNVTLMAALAYATPLVADPTGFTYGGRIVDATGKPVAGPVDLEVRFYDDDVDGNQVGPTKTIQDVPLTQGVFSITIDLTPAERDVVFGSAGAVYMQIKDTTHNKSYPRQSFGAVPYALRVPVDGTTIGYNATGELEVKDLSGVQQAVVSLDGPGSNNVTLQAAPGATAPTTLVLPPNAGSNDFVLTTDGAGNLTWTNKATGAGNMDTSTYDNEGVAGVIDLANGGTGANLNATGGVGQFVKQVSAGGAFTVGVITDAELPASIDPTKVGLGNVDDVSVLNTFTQNDAQRIGTDEIRARDAGGLKLFNDAGSSGLFVDDGGQVGIGTAVPSERLSVNGNVRVGATALNTDDNANYLIHSGGQLFIHANNSATGDTSFTDLSLAAGLAGNNGEVSISTSGLQRLRVTGGGNVGIGTTTPGRLLHLDTTAAQAMRISRSAAFTEYADIQLGSGSSGLSGKSLGFLAANGTMGFGFDSTGDGTYDTVLNQSGNVGIGTTSPQDRLHVDGRIRATDLCDENGANCKDLSVASAFGSVSSVGITQPAAGITVSGGPVTTSGSMTLALANDLGAVESLAGTGIARRTGADTWATLNDTAAGRTLLEAADATAQRTALGLTIGTNVQAYEATLAGLAATAPTANQMIYATGADTFTTASLTASGLALLDDASASAQRTTLGLAIGTDVQAYDATLAGIAATNTTADQLIYSSGVNTFATTTLSAAARGLLDDADASAMRTTLGISGTDPLNTFTQNDNQRIGTDEIRARDAGGLTLSDDSGTAAIFIEDGGDVGIGVAAPAARLHTVANGLQALRSVREDPTDAMAFVTNFERQRSDATAPGQLTGALALGLEGFTNNSLSPSSSIRWGWENAQTNDTTDRNTFMAFATTSGNTNGGQGGTERMRIASSGNVGIGTSTPAAATKLQVAGQIASGYYADTDANIDWALGNIQSTSVAAGTLVFATSSMVDGASYTLSLTNATGGNYVLSSADISSWRCIPACAANTVVVDATKHTVLTIIKMGTTGYVSWIKGF